MPEFDSEVNRIKNQLDRALTQKVIQVTALLQEELIERTPRDVSWARSNWVPGLVPDEKPAPAGGTREETQGKVGAAKIRAAHGLVQVLTGYLSAEKQGFVWITNNVPYILALNSKHKSKSGFIQKSIDIALARAALGAGGGGSGRAASG